MIRQLRSTFFQEPTTVYIKQLQMIGMPSFPFGSMPLFPLWCSGNACRGWTLLATLPRVVTRKLCFTICADCGDAFAFYLCRLGSQDCTGELGAPQPQMASAPVGDEAICQTFCVQWESRRPDSLLRKVARELGLATLTTALRVELLPRQQEQVTPQRRSRSFHSHCCRNK